MKQKSKKLKVHSVSTTSKVSHEVVGVAVPRKPRSASGKRSHEHSSCEKYGEVGKDQSLQQLSVKAASLSFSSVSSRKKMKPNGPKKSTRPPKTSKSSEPVEENIEIEIAEVLYGLMKQSPSSKESTSNLDAIDLNVTKEKKVEVQNASMAVQNSLNAESIEVESDDQPEKIETCSPESNGGSEGASGSMELHTEDAKPFMEDKESIIRKVELSGENSTGTKAISTGREDVFEFDLMTPPIEKDNSADFVSNPKPLAQDGDMKMEVLFKNEEKMEGLELLKKLGEKTEMTSQRPNENQKQDSCTTLQEGERRQPDTIVPKLEKTGGWPSDLSSMGPSTTLQVSSFLLSQPQPKRCATHCYIAHNIYSHQQVGKMSNYMPAATGSAPQCGTKSDILKVMLSSENIVIGNPLLEMHAQEKEDAANFTETSQRNHVVHQAPRPASASNQMHGHTSMFPLGQHQTSETPTSNQSGPLKDANPTNDASLLNHSAATPPKSSLALPPKAAVEFNNLNMTAKEGPYLAINGYPITISTPVGTATAIRGEHPAQAMPLFNGPWYANQMFQPSQVQLKQPHLQLQHQVGPSHQNTSMSSDSSPSHKQQESRQLQETQQCSINNFSSSLQPLQPCKLDGEMNEDNPASSHGQKKVYGQNFTVPFQPLNFTLMPYVTVGGGGSGNHIEQSQQKGSKGRVELIPSKAYGMSFATFSGNHGVGTSLNFSSMAQNQARFQAARQKNHHHQIFKGKTNEELKAASGKSSSKVGQRQTLVFDNSARTLNFMSSAATESWPLRSITLPTLAKNSPSVGNASSSSQPQHLFQFRIQNQHMLQHEQSCVATKLPKNSPAHPKSPQLKNSMVLSFPHQQVRASKGQTEISFGGNPKSNNQYPSSILACSSISTSKPQQIENSPSGSSQMSSPACGRNLPSILTTCPSHISELKY